MILRANLAQRTGSEGTIVIAMIAVVVGTTMLSAVLAYSWWCRIRVVALRQDIFDLRDGLFDVALAESIFDDPAYRFARQHLNQVANVADSITIPVLAFVLHRGVKEITQPKSDNDRMQQAIELAMRQCVERIMRFLWHQTFTGWVVRPILSLVHISTLVESQTHRWMERWVKSTVAEELSAPRLCSLTGRFRD